MSSDTLAYRGTNFIGGKEVPAQNGSTFLSIDPLTGKAWGEFAQSSASDVDAAVADAHTVFEGPWRRLSATGRGRLLMRWGDAIAEHGDRIAELDSAQNGKLLAEVRAQARAARDWLYYFGGLSDKVQGAVIPLESASTFNYTTYEALGVVGTIVPWNGPIFLTVMSVAPALAAGNTVVIKPSEISSASALELAQLAIEAGIPPGTVNVVTGARETGEALVDNPLVRKIIFTGGDAAGRAIAARAGGRLIGCTLELGGKSPNIIFADADREQALAGVLAGIFAGAGQGCLAGSRAYVHASIFEEFIERLVSRASAIQIGSPFDPLTQMGPIATQAHLDKIHGMVQRAVEGGATLRCGGGKASVDGLPKGCFYQPTILTGAAPDSELMRDEVFGPVLAIAPFSQFDEVVRLANDTRFGLAAGLWTTDLRTAHRCAKELRAGTVWINTYRAIAPASPFGGMKDSGLGRQNGIDSIYQYMQVKSVWCELDEGIADPFLMKV
ncbi:aldehyde dehydrogenase [Paraburkholderia sediminicola]|uniref:aldehyde dehydrogenase n=1 Tax=Paraburkholderia sediminicola TaxID=458836 RepID=UPI0038B825BA